AQSGRGQEVRRRVSGHQALHRRRGVRRLAEGPEDPLRGQRDLRPDLPGREVEMADAAPSVAMPRRRWRPGVLPGFAPTLAITISYLSLLVLIPLAALVIKSAGLSWAQFWSTISSPRALAAYKLSFGGALVAAAVNSAAGLLLAWILVRYRFFGKAVVD